MRKGHLFLIHTRALSTLVVKSVDAYPPDSAAAGSTVRAVLLDTLVALILTLHTASAASLTPVALIALYRLLTLEPLF